MPKYCCLFNHYNANKTINTYVFKILDYFSSLDCETIIISNSPIENEEAKAQFKEHFKGQYFERENKGYDFGAWQYAFNKDLIPNDTEYLFLLNDSIFGPLFDLDPVLQKMLSDQSIDFWGLTDSHEQGWHLQSYFLCFNRTVFRSSTFKNFFKQSFNAFSKKEIINNGELKLATALINSGFRGKAYIEYEKLIEGSEKHFKFKNPTHFFAFKLIKEFKFPFIKKELIFFNPENIDIQDGVLSMLEKETSYPIHLIEEAIKEKCAVESNGLDFPLIDIMSHIYYLNTAYRFIIELSEMKSYNCRFFFNISDNLYGDQNFIKILTFTFKNCVIIRASNVGKDIGGKLAMIDLCIKLKLKSTYTILLHDKQSPHSSLGEIWRKKLFRIIEPEYVTTIENIFQGNDKIGIVAAGEFIKNEYNNETRNFDCTSNDILKNIFTQYHFSNKNFDFVGGTMFWIRTEIITSFFSEHSALAIRATLEKGNVLDNNSGSVTHSWERILSWVATNGNYVIKGINESV